MRVRRVVLCELNCVEVINPGFPCSACWKAVPRKRTATAGERQSYSSQEFLPCLTETIGFYSGTYWRPNAEVFQGNSS